MKEQMEKKMKEEPVCEQCDGKEQHIDMSRITLSPVFAEKEGGGLYRLFQTVLMHNEDSSIEKMGRLDLGVWREIGPNEVLLSECAVVHNLTSVSKTGHVNRINLVPKDLYWKVRT